MSIKNNIIEEYDRVVQYHGREHLDLFYRYMSEDYGYSKNQCYRLRDGIDRGLDIDYYLDARLDEPKMFEIYLGLKKKLDVNKYNSYKYNVSQMILIRKGLELGLNVDLYNNFNYSYELMSKIFKKLKDRKKHEDHIDRIDTEINLLIIES